MIWYFGPSSDLSGERRYTNLSEIWLHTAKKRRQMRSVGIRESALDGSEGDYPLLCAYLQALRSDPEELLSAQEELSALGLSDLINDASALWQKSADLLEQDAAKISERILSAGNRIRAVTPLAAAPSDRREILPAADITVFCTLGAGIKQALSALSDAVGYQADSPEALLRAIEQQLTVYADAGCDTAVLTVAERLPPCLRQNDQDAERALLAARKRDGGADAAQDALASRLLFGILPMLHRRGMTLLLRAGATECGDGRLPCRFDAGSFAAYATRLKEQMPRTLLLPRSSYALPAMQALTGIFPSAACGQPAVRLASDDIVLSRGSILPLLAVLRAQNTSSH